MRRHRLATAAITVTLLSACASPGSRPAPAAAAPSQGGMPSSIRALKTAGPTWHRAAAKAGEILYPSAGIRTMPAPLAKPALPLAGAQAAAIDNAMVRVGSIKPEITLRMVQTGDFAGSTLTAPRLEWVVVFADAPDVHFGGPADHGPPAAPSGAPQSCDYTMFVDAMSGAPLGSFETCG